MNCIERGLYKIAGFINQYSMAIFICIWMIIIITGIIGIIGYTSSFIKGKSLEILIAVIVSMIAFSIGLLQLSLNNDKLFSDLFIVYNEQYDKRFNDYLNKFIEVDAEQKYNNGENGKEVNEALVVDYINLCAEEYLWYSKGRIDKKAWCAWKKGMLYYLTHEKIIQICIKESQQKDSYYGLFKEVLEKDDRYQQAINKIEEKKK